MELDKTVCWQVLEEAYLPTVPMKIWRFFKGAGLIRYAITEESADGNDITLVSCRHMNLGELRRETIYSIYESCISGVD